MRSLRAHQKGNQVTFNGENSINKLKPLINQKIRRFLSGASSVDRSNRKFITSETYYLKDVSHVPSLTTKYLDTNKKYVI